MRLCGFVSAMTGQPLSALAQSLPDVVELLGDGAQPFALMVLALLGGRRERDSFLADETLDPGEGVQFLGKLRELLGVRQGGAQGANVIMREAQDAGAAPQGRRGERRACDQPDACPLRGRQCSGSSGAREDDVVICARCGHGVPHALQSPLLAVGRLPTGMRGASAAAVSPRHFQNSFGGAWWWTDFHASSMLTFRSAWLVTAAEHGSAPQRRSRGRPDHRRRPG